MKAIAEQTIMVTFELTEFEAQWLKAVMQNPLDDVDPDREELEQRDLRVGLFEVLAEALED